MSITKLKSVGTGIWALPPSNVHLVGTVVNGRRVITGMLTGGETACSHQPTRPTAEVGHVTHTKGSGR
jgi:hypothetical protein